MAERRIATQGITKHLRIQMAFGGRDVPLFAAVALISAATALLLVAAIGPQLQRPVQASSKQSRAAGAAVFHEKGCEHCHGVDGVGTDRGPDLSSIGRRWKKDHIELQIRNGGGGMPPFGGALQPDEVDLLVDFLSSKRTPLKKHPEPAKKPSGSKPPVDDDGGS